MDSARHGFQWVTEIRIRGKSRPLEDSVNLPALPHPSIACPPKDERRPGHSVGLTPTTFPCGLENRIQCGLQKKKKNTLKKMPIAFSSQDSVFVCFQILKNLYLKRSEQQGTGNMLPSTVQYIDTIKKFYYHKIFQLTNFSFSFLLHCLK